MLTLLVPLAVACNNPAWTGDADDPSVVVIGDSLVYLSEVADPDGTGTLLTDELVSSGFRAYVAGFIGLTVEWGYPVVWELPSRMGIVPDVLVIALGTNDMHVDPATLEPSTTPEAAAVRLSAWLAAVPDACVRLVGVAESITGWGLDMTGPAWNAMLTEQAALHANAAFVPWEPDPSWTQGGQDPHMTADGEAAYRELLVAAATGCLD